MTFLVRVIEVRRLEIQVESVNALEAGRSWRTGTVLSNHPIEVEVIEVKAA